MTAQLSLLLPEPPPRPLSRQERAGALVLGAEYGDGFPGWLARNWRVYEAFERATLDWVHSTGWGGENRPHAGAKMIYEHLRYETQVRERDPTFKLNNNYTADLARLFMELNPEYVGLFEIRERRQGRVAA